MCQLQCVQVPMKKPSSGESSHDGAGACQPQSRSATKHQIDPTLLQKEELILMQTV